eukprot:3041067-Pyramimonas_sp.AAC.1
MHTFERCQADTAQGTRIGPGDVPLWPGVDQVLNCGYFGRPEWVRKIWVRCQQHLLSKTDSGRCWAGGLLPQMDN